MTDGLGTSVRGGVNNRIPAIGGRNRLAGASMLSVGSTNEIDSVARRSRMTGMSGGDQQPKPDFIIHPPAAKKDHRKYDRENPKKFLNLNEFL